jgi:uncharacterized membrane protein
LSDDVKKPERRPFPHEVEQGDFESVGAWFNSQFFRRDASEIIVYLSVVCYTLIFAYFTILKYNAFSAYAWDLGIFNQSLWTTLHSGKFFFSTVEQFIVPSGVFFGTHFSPILYMVLPFYALTSTPQALLVIQSSILALGAVPLYFFAKNSLNNKVLAAVFSLAYLLYPALQGANWFDFHVQAFLPLFFFCTMYFFATEKWPSYFLFVFLSLAVAENVPITVVFIGLYGFWRFRTRIINSLKTRRLEDAGFLVPILTIAIAVAWLFFAGWIRQANWPFSSDYLQLYKAVDHWSVLGITDDPNRLPVYVIINPGRAVAAFAYDLPLKGLYLFLLFGPLLFLSFASSITAISLAWLVPALFSNYTPYYTIGDHFPTYPIAFIFLGAVEGLRRISLLAGLPDDQSDRLRRLRLSLSELIPRTKTLLVIRQRFSLLVRKVSHFVRDLSRRPVRLLVVGFVFALTVGPLSPVITFVPYVRNNFPQFADYHLPATTSDERTHSALLQTISDMVPSNASILSQNSIFVHFSSRANAYVYPLPWMFTYDVTVTILLNGTAQPCASVQLGLLSQTTNATGSTMFGGLLEGNYHLVASYSSAEESFSYEFDFIVQKNTHVIADLATENYTGTCTPTGLQIYAEDLIQKSQFVMFDATTDKYTASLICNGTQTVNGYGLVAYAGTQAAFDKFRFNGIYPLDGICLFEKNYSGETQFFADSGS